MRSRYSAYALGETAYLLASWHPSTRPRRLDLDPRVRWYRLDILATAEGTALDEAGTVEFRARYFVDEEPGAQHEVSRFVREGERWFYLDATP